MSVLVFEKLLQRGTRPARALACVRQPARRPHVPITEPRDDLRHSHGDFSQHDAKLAEAGDALRRSHASSLQCGGPPWRPTRAIELRRVASGSSPPVVVIIVIVFENAAHAN